MDKFLEFQPTFERTNFQLTNTLVLIYRKPIHVIIGKSPLSLDEEGII